MRIVLNFALFLKCIETVLKTVKILFNTHYAATSKTLCTL